LFADRNMLPGSQGNVWADYSKTRWRRSDDRAAAGTPLITNGSQVRRILADRQISSLLSRKL